MEEHNLSTKTKPQKVNLDKYLEPSCKQRHIDFLQQFKDVFAWSYKELKTYDTSIIQHRIPLKEDSKPFV